MLDGAQQLRVFLADNLIKSRRLHSGIDQLLERFPGFYALMLARVANEENPVAEVEFGEKIAHLLGAGEARFIHHIYVAFRCRLLMPCKEALKRISIDAGIAELMRGARRWGEALDNHPALFGGLAHGF